MTAEYDLTTAPNHITTIDQHRGTHHTGLDEVRLTDVRTRFADHCQDSWESLDADAREWWCGNLSDLHAAEVELASLPRDHRDRATAKIDEQYRRGMHDGIEYAAGVIRDAIAATAEEE